jgi:hypothetical protein
VTPTPASPFNLGVRKPKSAVFGASIKTVIKGFPGTPDGENKTMALVVKSAVAEIVRKKDMRMSAETYDGLDAKVSEMLAAAIKRADGNGRKTVMAQDL